MAFGDIFAGFQEAAQQHYSKLLSMQYEMRKGAAESFAKMADDPRYDEASQQAFHHKSLEIMSGDPSKPISSKDLDVSKLMVQPPQAPAVAQGLKTPQLQSRPTQAGMETQPGSPNINLVPGEAGGVMNLPSAATIPAQTRQAQTGPITPALNLVPGQGQAAPDIQPPAPPQHPVGQMMDFGQQMERQRARTLAATRPMMPQKVDDYISEPDANGDSYKTSRWRTMTIEPTGDPNNPFAANWTTHEERADKPVRKFAPRAFSRGAIGIDDVMNELNGGGAVDVDLSGDPDTAEQKVAAIKARMPNAIFYPIGEKRFYVAPNNYKFQRIGNNVVAVPDITSGGSSPYDEGHMYVFGQAQVPTTQQHVITETGPGGSTATQKVNTERTPQTQPIGGQRVGGAASAVPAPQGPGAQALQPGAAPAVAPAQSPGTATVPAPQAPAIPPPAAQTFPGAPAAPTKKGGTSTPPTGRPGASPLVQAAPEVANDPARPPQGTANSYRTAINPAQMNSGLYGRQQQIIIPMKQVALQAFGDPNEPSSKFSLDSEDMAAIAMNRDASTRVGKALTYFLNDMQRINGGSGASISFGPAHAGFGGSMVDYIGSLVGMPQRFAAQMVASAQRMESELKTPQERAAVQNLIAMYGAIPGLRAATRGSAYEFYINSLERELPAFWNIQSGQEYYQKLGKISTEIRGVMNDFSMNPMLTMGRDEVAGWLRLPPEQQLAYETKEQRRIRIADQQTNRLAQVPEAVLQASMNDPARIQRYPNGDVWYRDMNGQVRQVR